MTQQCVRISIATSALPLWLHRARRASPCKRERGTRGDISGLRGWGFRLADLHSRVEFGRDHASIQRTFDSSRLFMASSGKVQHLNGCAIVLQCGQNMHAKKWMIIGIETWSNCAIPVEESQPRGEEDELQSDRGGEVERQTVGRHGRKLRVVLKGEIPMSASHIQHRSLCIYPKGVASGQDSSSPKIRALSRMCSPLR